MPQDNLGRQNKHSMGFPVMPAPYRSKPALCPGMSTAEEALHIRHALDEQQASNEQFIA